ncbi:MAG: protein kinase [Verrucomicrobiota bacterium]
MSTCSNCGSPVPARAPVKLCPRCLLVSAELAPAEATPRERIGGYEIIEEIARGGMGVVFRARQVNANRLVALKMILTGELASRQSVQRFLIEAQAAAKLDHPNIVPIYEVGEEDGRRFFAMKLVEGGTLAERMPEYAPSPPARARGSRSLEPGRERRIAQVAGKLAQALAYAHRRGVLHRDIKSSNILIDAQGEPQLTDFGLAKLTDNEIGVTLATAVMGSPAYMAPEQASGRREDVTTAADIYSLGVVLYELLTGTLPFRAGSPLAVMRKVLDEEPTPPSAVVPEVDSDLEVICLKCLEKDPARRYSSAEALAEDLERWQRNEPIFARSAGSWERGIKWIRRNPARASLAGTVVLSVLAISAISSVLGYRAQQARSQAEQAKQQTDNANRQLASNVRHFEWQEAEELAQTGHRADALALFARLLRDQPEDPIAATRILSMLSQRSFGLPMGQPLRHHAAVLSAYFNGTGDRIVTSSIDGLAKIWNARTTELLFVLTNGCGASAQFSRDSKCVLAFCVDNQLRTFDAENGRPLARIEGYAVNKTGRPDTHGHRAWLLADAKTAQCWDAVTGQAVGPPLPHPAEIRSLDVSPDGQWLGVGCANSVVYVWNLEHWRLAWESTALGGWIRSLAFNPDGSRLMAGSSLGNVAFWEPASGTLLREVRAETNEISHAVFSPDGKFVTTVTFQNRARLWDGHSGAILSAPFGEMPLHALQFAPDSRRLCLATREGTAQLWDALTQEPVSEPFEHEGPIERLDFSADGHTVASASQDGTARLWDVRMQSSRRAPIKLSGRSFAVEFSPDGTRVALADNATARLYQTESGAPIGQPMAHDLTIYTIEFSPDGHKICTTSEDETVRTWDAQTGVQLSSPKRHQSVTWTVRFSPDGQLIATTSRDRRMRLYQVDSDQPLVSVLHPDEVIAAEFSPDGKGVLTSCLDGAVRFYSLAQLLANRPAEQALLVPPMLAKGVVWMVGFSPDGRQIVTASADRTAQLWDAQTGQPLGASFRHSRGVWTATFSRDGRWVLTGSDDGTARVWDAQTHRPISAPMKHRNNAPVFRAWFSPDSQFVVTGSADGTARVWDARTGFQLSEPMQHAGWVYRMQLSRDGSRVVTAGRDLTARVWDVLIAPPNVPLWLASLAESLAGRRLTPGREIEPVAPEELQTLKSQLCSNSQQDFYSRWARWFFLERNDPSAPRPNP